MNGAHQEELTKRLNTIALKSAFETIRAFLPSMTQGERWNLFFDIRKGYCDICGSDEDGHNCLEENDGQL